MTVVGFTEHGVGAPACYAAYPAQQVENEYICEFFENENILDEFKAVIDEELFHRSPEMALFDVEMFKNLLAT